MKHLLFKCFIATWLLLSPVSAMAHEDLHQRISTLDALIEVNPYDPALLLERAMLHVAHETPDLAICDILQAKEIDADYANYDVYMARAYMQAGLIESAIAMFVKGCEVYPEDGQAHWLLGLAYQQNQQLQLAATTMQHALPMMERPLPEHFVCLATLQQQQAQPTAAMLTLEAGIEALGELPVLLNNKVTLLREQQENELALQVVESMLSQQPTWRKWQKLRAELLIELHRIDDAKQQLEIILQNFQQMPESVQQLPANQTYLSSIEQLLQTLDALGET